MVLPSILLRIADSGAVPAPSLPLLSEPRSQGRDENPEAWMADLAPITSAHQSAAALISNHVVRQMSAYTGRGPTRAWTSIDGELISVVLRDTLTKGERSLVG